MELSGSWAVEYNDGTYLSQWDTVPEVPLQAIDWSRVTRIMFDSALATVVYPIPPAPEGTRWSLRRRTWVRFREYPDPKWEPPPPKLNPDTGKFEQLEKPPMIIDQENFTAFLLVLSTDFPVTAENCLSVLFWFPDGVTHETPHLNSPEAEAYGSGRAHDIQRSLMPITDIAGVGLDAQLTKDGA